MDLQSNDSEDDDIMDINDNDPTGRAQLNIIQLNDDNIVQETIDNDDILQTINEDEVNNEPATDYNQASAKETVQQAKPNKTGGNSVLSKHELNHQVDEGEFDIRIKEGAVRFESNLNARVRMNVLSCVKGFDLQTELDFLDYLYYHDLVDKLIEFIAPDIKHLEEYIGYDEGDFYNEVKDENLEARDESHDASKYGGEKYKDSQEEGGEWKEVKRKGKKREKQGSKKGKEEKERNSLYKVAAVQKVKRQENSVDCVSG